MAEADQLPIGEHISELAYVRRDLSELVQQTRTTPTEDTGLSVDHHLHFSIHDSTLPAARSPGPFNPAGRSVRPTPMNGQRLIEADDGSCVSSTNV